MIPQHPDASFYRQAQGLTVSNIGIGTYLGAPGEATDRGYIESIKTAADMGVNLIDTSLNYRHQGSERAVGAALKGLPREKFVVCTKAGYLVPDAVPASLKRDDVCGGVHSLAPDFLADQLDRSRKNLGIDTIDVFYLHNPEHQLSSVPRDQFNARISRAFEFLEKAVTEKYILFYGAATWDGFRRGPGSPAGLLLDDMVSAAQAAGGREHHFRFIQLPFNLAMPEAYVQRSNGENVLGQAMRHGITVIASASLLQARLIRNLPEQLAAQLPGLETGAQRAIQFTRSTPGITSALAGMSNPEHVRENLKLAAIPPLTESEYRALYRQG